MFGTRTSVPVSSATTGLVFDCPLPGNYTPIPPIVVNYLLLTAIAMLMVLINRQFNLVKSTSWYFVSIFFIMMLCFAGVAVTCYGMSNALALVLFIDIMILFSTYGAPKATRTVFLIFCLLAAASLWIAQALFFLPLFIAGMWQMRVMTPRGIIAMILGLITPFWIVWGFELAPPFELHFDIGSDWNVGVIADNLPFFITLALLCLQCLIFLVGVAMRAINYNAARRACNGFMMLATLMTLILLYVDFSNITLYITTFNMLVAFQTSHYLFSRGNEIPGGATAALTVVLIGLVVLNMIEI